MSTAKAQKTVKVPGTRLMSDEQRKLVIDRLIAAQIATIKDKDAWIERALRTGTTSFDLLSDRTLIEQYTPMALAAAK